MKIKTMPVGALATNCYLLEDPDTNAAALVDPGGEAKRILAQIKADGVNVTAIFLTHGHNDHTDAVQELWKTLPNVPVYIHPADGAMLGDSDYPNFGKTMPYQEGDTIQVGNLSVKVLHTPGHTPGGVCLCVGDTLFTGDTLFKGSMGRTDFRGGNYDEMVTSLRRLNALQGDYRVLPGHAGASTLDQERKTNYYLIGAARS